MNGENFDELSEPQLYINRELSLLEFNRRVLEQARDESLPLLERLRFMTISSSNLDEFFEIRVASHKERASLGSVQSSVDGLTPSQTLAAVSGSAASLVQSQYEVLNLELLPALENEGIRLLSRSIWSDEQRAWIASYFRDSVLPALSPVGLDPAHPFPRILNKSLNFVVMLDGEDAYGRDTDLAVVQVPRSLPRIVKLADEVCDSPNSFVMISSIIHAHIDELFAGMKTVGCHQFRVTRNGDLWFDEEEVDDILQALSGELPERKYSEAVRLEVTEDCPEPVSNFLLKKFALEENDLYRVDGPVNLHRLEALYALVDRPDLKFDRFAPRVPKQAQRGESLFDAIRANDILLHHPYDSFQPVLDLLRQAASDPQVLAIQQTLYRTGAKSPVAEALIEAARAGKQVTVVIELRARFDEAENIDFATRLQEVGATVVYGVVGLKTHAKMLLVVRREGKRLRRYVHLGTGNYHPGTARSYTDLGYMTADPDFAEDVQQLFSQLSGAGQVRDLSLLVQAPFDLHSKVIELIDEETRRARRGEKARIRAKMNALTERDVIKALYKASQAGVEIHLVVRGACCLRPGITDISDNIRVISVIGRFLEHSRVWNFHAGGEEQVYLSSADWMSRNLLRRVEVAFPITELETRAQIIEQDLDIYLAEDVRSWELSSIGVYAHRPENGEWRDAQQLLLERICTADERIDLDSQRRKLMPAPGDSSKVERIREEAEHTKAKKRRKLGGKKRDR